MGDGASDTLAMEIPGRNSLILCGAPHKMSYVAQKLMWRWLIFSFISAHLSSFYAT
jgi:hypothetical protein